jgi:hypothetical protein
MFNNLFGPYESPLFLIFQIKLIFKVVKISLSFVNSTLFSSFAHLKCNLINFLLLAIKKVFTNQLIVHKLFDTN